MAKVYSPNKKYDGITAGVQFSNGVGESTDKYILEYLKSKGYVIKDNETDTVDTELEALKKEAIELGIKFNNKIGKEKLAEKIEEFKKLSIPNNTNIQTDNPSNEKDETLEDDDLEDFFEDLNE